MDLIDQLHHALVTFYKGSRKSGSHVRAADAEVRLRLQLQPVSREGPSRILLASVRVREVGVAEWLAAVNLAPQAEGHEGAARALPVLGAADHQDVRRFEIDIRLLFTLFLRSSMP